MRLLIVLTVCFGISAFGQNDRPYFLNNFYFGAKGSLNYLHGDVRGLSNFFSDFSFENDSRDELDFSYGLSISNQVLPYLNLSIEYNQGSISGTEINRTSSIHLKHVKSSWSNYQFSTKLFINRLFKKRLKAADYLFYIEGGIGILSSKGTVYNLVDDNTNQHLEELTTFNTNYNLTTSLGSGFIFKLSRGLDMDIGVRKNFTYNDELDGLYNSEDYNRTADNLFTMYFGLNRYLGRRKKYNSKWDKTKIVINYAKTVKPKEKSKITVYRKSGTKTIIAPDGSKTVIKNEDSELVLLQHGNQNVDDGLDSALVETGSNTTTSFARKAAPDSTNLAMNEPIQKIEIVENTISKIQSENQNLFLKRSTLENSYSMNELIEESKIEDITVRQISQLNIPFNKQSLKNVYNNELKIQEEPIEFELVENTSESEVKSDGATLWFKKSKPEASNEAPIVFSEISPDPIVINIDQDNSNNDINTFVDENVEEQILIEPENSVPVEKSKLVTHKVDALRTFTVATEVSNKEALAVQKNNIENSLRSSDNEYVLADNSVYVSSLKKYIFEKTNTDRKIHSIEGSSQSKVEELISVQVVNYPSEDNTQLNSKGSGQSTTNVILTELTFTMKPEQTKLNSVQNNYLKQVSNLLRKYPNSKLVIIGSQSEKSDKQINTIKESLFVLNSIEIDRIETNKIPNQKENDYNLTVLK